MRPNASVPLKSVALPTEHGGWGFTLEPLLLGLLLAPGPPTLGLFLLGLFGFLARHPLKLLYQDLRRGKRYPRTELALRMGAAYLALSLAGLLLALLTAEGRLLLPLLLALPLGAYVAYTDARNRSRDLFPEVAAALFMAAFAPAGVLAGGLPPKVALGSLLALALRDVAALYHARTQVLRARGQTPRLYPALLALWGSALLALLSFRQGFLPSPTLLALLLLALFGSLTLLRPPVPARVVGWTQMGFGLLIVLATALGYTLQGLPTGLLGASALHRGLGLALGYPVYVVDIDPDRNAVVVGSDRDLLREEVLVDRVNWVAIPELTGPLEVTARIRYHAPDAAAVIEPAGEGRVLTRFREPQRAVTPGQAVVWYRDDLVVGGGVAVRTPHPAAVAAARAGAY
uniref:tRNA-specific 2-thiouridylase MnmA-like C-terminal domain-containing protein n=1 Tax=Thermus islandicus TaxID=540988 RepID=A0A7C2FT87_9DEIN